LHHIRAQLGSSSEQFTRLLALVPLCDAERCWIVEIAFPEHLAVWICAVSKQYLSDRDVVLIAYDMKSWDFCEGYRIANRGLRIRDRAVNGR